MKTIESPGYYASKWGLTDLYAEAEKLLREAIDSGEDFTTGWWTCKKECRSARYTRKNGKMTVEVCCDIDSLNEGDLVYDAVYHIYHEEREVTDEQMEEILDLAWFYDLSDGVSVSGTISKNKVSFDTAMQTTAYLENKAEKQLDQYFDRLCAIVREVMDRD